MSLVSGKYWTGDPKIKPEAWGPVEDVKAAVRENADKIYGIDPNFLNYWPVWEKAGNILQNYGIGGNGVAFDGYSWEKNYIAFNGLDGYVSTEHDDSFCGETMTFCFIFNQKSNTPSDGFISKYELDGDNRSYAIRQTNSNELSLLNSSLGTGYAIANSNVSFCVNNVRTFACIRFDRGDISFFKNAEAWGVASGEGQSLYNNSSTPLHFGTYRQYFIDAMVENIIIAPQSYTISQISKLYDNPYGLSQQIIRRSYFIPDGEIPVFNLAALHASRPTRIIQ